MVTVHAVAVVVSWEIAQTDLCLWWFNFHCARLRPVVNKTSLQSRLRSNHLVILPSLVVMRLAVQRMMVSVFARPVWRVLRNRSEHI